MQRRVGRIRIDGRLAEQQPRPPVVSLSAAAGGPVVAITANVHGDEVTGLLAIHELDRVLADRLTAGTALLYPSLNPIGLAARSRGVGGDGPDLNRLFPGDAAGTPAERLAHAIWRDLVDRGLQVLVDLHADSAASIPYAIIDRPVALRGRARTDMEASLVAHAEATGLTVLRDYPADQYQRFGLDRSLAGAMVNKARLPAVTIEAGPRRLVDPDAVAAVVEAVLGMLGALGMIEHEPTSHPTRVEGGPWRRSTHLRIQKEGLFVPMLAPGSRYAVGDVLAEVRGVTGESLERVRATEQGIVVSWLDSCWVAAGGSIGTLGISDDDRDGRETQTAELEVG